MKPRRAIGSAAVEFVMMAPFVLMLSGFVWDVRAYISHRTDLAREVYVIAEVVAGAAANPLARTSDPNDQRLVDAFIDRFARRGAGTVDVAVVRRGATRHDGVTPCPDPDGTSATWCPPTVTVRWPPATARDEGRWQDARRRLTVGGDCAGPATLPAEGADFAANVPMLPNEAATGNEDDWPSRRMLAEEWWVVVDVCLHPGPGVFTGRLIQAGYETVDFGSYTTRFRAAWRSIHDAATCDWCNFPTP